MDRDRYMTSTKAHDCGAVGGIILPCRGLRAAAAEGLRTNTNCR